MNQAPITLDFEGRRVVIDQATQEVRVLDPAGNLVSRERIQVAAGSVQGIFSAVQGAASVLAPPHRNA